MLTCWGEQGAGSAYGETTVKPVIGSECRVHNECCFRNPCLLGMPLSSCYCVSLTKCGIVDKGREAMRVS